MQTKKMKILAHRGLWKTEQEKNSLRVLEHSLHKGFGIETDIRDYREELVISHNIADITSPKLEDFLVFYQKQQSNLPLALNVKADGIQWKLKVLLEKYQISNYFLFDMSVPEMVVNRREGLRFYTRHSDVESECVLYEQAEGVWLDSFYEINWLTEEIIEKHLSDQKKVSIISSEIHGYPHQHMWEMIKTNGFFDNQNVMLCTDLPIEARSFFEL